MSAGLSFTWAFFCEDLRRRSGGTLLQFIVDLRGNRASRAELQANQMGGSPGAGPIWRSKRGTERVKESKSFQVWMFFPQVGDPRISKFRKDFSTLEDFFFFLGGVILHLKSECDWILLVAPSDSQLQQGQHADTVDCCPCNLDSSNVKGFVGCPFSIAREV